MSPKKKRKRKNGVKDQRNTHVGFKNNRKKGNAVPGKKCRPPVISG